MTLRTSPWLRGLGVALAAVLTFGAVLPSAQASNVVSSDSETDVPQPVLTVAPEQTVTAAPSANASHPGVDFLVEIENPGDTTMSGGSVSLWIAPERISRSDDLSAAFPETSVELFEAHFASVPGGTTRQESYTVPLSAFPEAMRTPDPQHSAAGIYIVEARFDATAQVTDEPNADPPTALRDTTALIWHSAMGPQAPPSAADPGATPPAAQVSLIVPIVLPERVWSLPTRAELRDIFAEDATLPTLLTAAEKYQATLAIDPRIIVGIRAHGDTAPADAQTFLARLEKTSLPSFLLQYGDADIAAQAALGLNEPLQPTGASIATAALVERSDETGDEAADEATDETTDQATDATTDEAAQEDTDAELPQFDELAAWQQTAGETLWPAAGAVTDETLALANRTSAKQLILDDRNAFHDGGPAAKLGGFSVWVNRGAISDALSGVFAAETQVRRAAAAVEAVALLGFDTRNNSKNLLVSLDRGAVSEAIDADAAGDPVAALQLLDQQGWISFTPLKNQPPGTAMLRAASVDPTRIEVLDQALEREATMLRAGHVLDQPQLLVDDQRFRLLSLFATRWAGNAAEFAEVTEDFRSRDAELIAGVEVVGASHTQLFGTASRVPVQLRNGFPFSASVNLLAQPTSGALTVDTRNLGVVQLAAGETKTVLVPIRARVTSGQSGIIVTLNTVDTGETVATQSFDVTISSRVETVVMLITVVAAALFVGFGVWRSVRRKQKSEEFGAGSSTGIQ